MSDSGLQRNRKAKAAFTMVEMIVAIGIVGVLFSLLMPAVQVARETARRMSCQNNLKQLSLAATEHEAAFGRMIGPIFYGLPTSEDYKGEEGLFVRMLPYLEQQPLFDSFQKGQPSVSLLNRTAIDRCPITLTCPSSGSSRLRNLAGILSGPPMPELKSETCDYIGNGGWFAPDQIAGSLTQFRGAVVTQVQRERPALRLAEITDGSSNTFLLWENSMAGLKRFPFGRLVDVDANVPAAIFIGIGNDGMLVNGQASVKSYIYSWCGVKTGAVWVYDSLGMVGNPYVDPRFGRAMNVINETGQPFSLHPGGCSFAMVDGSVHFLSEGTEAKLVVSGAVINDGNLQSP